MRRIHFTYVCIRHFTFNFLYSMFSSHEWDTYVVCWMHKWMKWSLQLAQDTKNEANFIKTLFFLESSAPNIRITLHIGCGGAWNSHQRKFTRNEWDASTTGSRTRAEKIVASLHMLMWCPYPSHTFPILTFVLFHGGLHVVVFFLSAVITAFIYRVTCFSRMLFDSVARARIPVARSSAGSSLNIFFWLNNFTGGWQSSRCMTISFRWSQTFGALEFWCGKS